MADQTGQKVILKDELNQSFSNNAALSAYQGYRLAHGEARDSTKLPTAGGTMTGTLRLNDKLILNSATYGTVLPNSNTTGRIFFLQQNASGAINNSDVVNYVYPVGSIYMSVNNTSPATLFGGTWTQLKDRFLLGAGSSYTNGNTGGAATHTHPTGDFTLTTSHIPAHTHGSKTLTGTLQSVLVDDGSGQTISFTGVCSGTTPRQRSWSGTTGNAIRKVTITATHTHNSVGSGTAHNHGNTEAGSSLPPYLVVYMWKRTG